MDITHMKVWVVRNPGPNSSRHDILFESTIEGLFQYRKGCVLSNGVDLWKAEIHRVFNDREEAQKEADKRWNRRGRTTSGVVQTGPGFYSEVKSK